jgi:hypothetical protein
MPNGIIAEQVLRLAALCGLQPGLHTLAVISIHFPGEAPGTPPVGHWWEATIDYSSAPGRNAEGRRESCLMDSLPLRMTPSRCALTAGLTVSASVRFPRPTVCCTAADGRLRWNVF